MRLKFLLLLFLVCILGLFLRLYRLPTVPPALNWDEVSHGYNAYSILKTGKDEWGQPFPITNFRAYGDYPLPLNLYLTIPSIAAFGLDEFGVRFPHAFLGTLTIAAASLFAYGVTGRATLSLFVGFLVAVDPWHLFASRTVLQSNVSVFLTTLSMALFFNRQKHQYFLPLSFFFLGLTLFSYHSTRIFSPFLLTAILIIYRGQIKSILARQKVVALVSLFVVALFSIALLFVIGSPESGARAKWVFLVDQGAVNRIIEQRERSSLPSALTRFVYNRPVYFLKEFSKNYLGYFSPQFLFLAGGTQYQFSVPGFGLLHWVNLPFFYYGIFLILKDAKGGKKESKLLLAWLLLSAIPASMTKEHFAVVRSTTMLPLPELLAAMGFFSALGIIKRTALLAGLAFYVILLVVGAGNYLVGLFASYSVDYSWAWQYGYKEVVDYAKANYARYDKIIVTKKYGEPHEFFLFYWPWDPEKYREDPNLVRFKQSDWFWVDRFDKFYFVNDWEIVRPASPAGGDRVREFVLESGGTVDCRDERCLLVTSPGSVPGGWSKITAIEFLDGKPAFELYE